MDFFVTITALAALAVVVVQSILKLNVIPVFFANKFPVLTNIVLSIIAAVVVTWSNLVVIVGFWHWVAYVGTVVVLAAVTYNATLRNSAGYKAATSAKSLAEAKVALKK